MHAAMQEDIVNAMALTGQVLMGQSVMVKSSEVRLQLVRCTGHEFGHAYILVACQRKNKAALMFCSAIHAVLVASAC